MPDSTKKKLLDAALETLVKTAPLPMVVKLPATYVSELAKRFKNLPDEQQAAFATATEETIHQALLQIDFSARHSAEALAGVYRIEGSVNQLADQLDEALRLLRRPGEQPIVAELATERHGKSVFISHSSRDKPFAEKLYGKLQEAGHTPWLDKFDLYAGDLQKQIRPTVKTSDIFLIVLSENSLASDWVEAELDWARARERESGKDMLCPVALDEAWHEKMEDVLWRQLKRVYVLDFSSWKTKKFDEPFGRLVRGIEENY